MFLLCKVCLYQKDMQDSEVVMHTLVLLILFPSNILRLSILIKNELEMYSAFTTMKAFRVQAVSKILNYSVEVMADFQIIVDNSVCCGS